MKLISNEKIAEFQTNNPLLLSNIDECAAAKLALDFAENEFQNLAIDFGNFLGKNHYRYNEIMRYWFNDRMTSTFTTEELLFKFNEQRNK